MNGHRKDIKHSRNKPVAEDFNKPDHMLENLRLAVIKKSQRYNKTTMGSQRTKNYFKFDCVNKGLDRDYSFMSHYL